MASNSLLHLLSRVVSVYMKKSEIFLAFAAVVLLAVIILLNSVISWTSIVTSEVLKQETINIERDLLDIHNTDGKVAPDVTEHSYQEDGLINVKPDVNRTHRMMVDDRRTYWQQVILSAKQRYDNLAAKRNSHRKRVSVQKSRAKGASRMVEEPYISLKKTPSSSFVDVGLRIPYVSVPGINCEAIIANDVMELSNAHVYQRQYAKEQLTDDYYIQYASNCTKFVTERHYITVPLSSEESKYPLAYSILMFQDVEQFERLLRAIYRPQNYYCIHVDKVTQESVFKAVRAIVSCFDNVHLASKRTAVRWGSYTVIEPELTCMRDLARRSKRWKYFINLTGQEFPLKTNWDIVKILKVFNGANNMEGTVKRRDNYRFTGLPSPPFKIRLTKGSVHIVASRGFVEFILFNQTAIEFFEWVKDTYIPDETFFSSLNHNPHLGAPGAYLGVPETDTHLNRFIARFKNWGDGPFNWPCHGQRVRYICIFGVADLPLLASRPELFANKFYLTYEPLALDCLEQLHYNRTRDEAVGNAVFDVSFYQQLSFVNNHQ